MLENLCLNEKTCSKHFFQPLSSFSAEPKMHGAVVRVGRVLPRRRLVRQAGGRLLSRRDHVEAEKLVTLLGSFDAGNHPEEIGNKVAGGTRSEGEFHVIQ